MQPKTQAIAILNRAADLVEAGWCQGDMARLADGTQCSYMNPNAAVFCALGAYLRAASEVAGGDDDDGPARRLAFAALQMHRLHQRNESFTYWNDVHATSGAEVGAVLRSAAKAARRMDDEEAA